LSWFRRIFGAGSSKIEPDEPEVVELEQAEPNPLEGDVLGGGAIVEKDLSVRTHRCPVCGLVIDRDVNAARNISKEDWR
jgi:hypothetical protein